MDNKFKMWAIAAPLLFSLVSCNESNTEVNNNSANPVAGDTQQAQSNAETANNAIDKPKTDAEIMLEGGKLILNTTMDLVERQRIKDSINAANKEKMYAYQIGLKYKEKDAFNAYNTLSDAGISNIYIFKAGRKEYYIVKYEAKDKAELEQSIEDLKTQLGNNGTEGVDVVNLMDYCSSNETIAKYTKSENGVEIRCLMCD